MTFQIASIVSCLLFPLFGWLAMWLAKRTIYHPATTVQGAQRDEGAEREKLKNMRERSVKKTFVIYGWIVVALFVMAWLTVPAKKVHAALFPTATPTITLTFTPTLTRTPTRTPPPTRTPSPTSLGADAGNFLTSLAVTTPGTARPSSSGSSSSSSSSSGGGTVIQTRIVAQTVVVMQTRVVYVTHINYVPITVPVTVIVTVTETPQASPTVTDTPLPTFTHTETASPTLTATETASPTPTETPE